ncbi:MAG: DUF1905 domain-containing protein [Clostridiales bacterium]|nr:DUF1905 domain-containing protein [Clostridiales bacterium]
MNITFEAIPESIAQHLVLRLPTHASAALPSRVMVMAEGTINGTTFTAPLEPDGRGGHWLDISPALASAAKVAAEQAVPVLLRPTNDWPEPEMPDDIMEALGRESLLPQWHSLTTKARWAWLRWIRSTANPATRSKRIAVAIDKLQRGDRRPCCFNAAGCTVPEVSKGGVLLEAAASD